MHEENKKKRNWKKTLLIASVCALGIFASAGIGAYLADADQAINAITVGGNRISLVEEFTPPSKLYAGVEIPKDVKATNTGTVDCFVRIFAEYTTSDMGQYCTIDWNTEDWTYNEGDGYWYYNEAIAPGKTTTSLFTKITLSEEIPEAAIKDFDVLVYAESYQSHGFTDYEEAWGTEGYRKNEKDILGPAIIFDGSAGMTASNPVYVGDSDYLVEFKVTDSTGIKSVTVNGADASGNTNGTWDAAITLEPDTVTEITVVATDTVATEVIPNGNTNTQTRYVYYDTISPVIRFDLDSGTNNDDPIITDEAAITLTGTATDIGSGVTEFTINEEKVALSLTGAWSKNFTLEPNTLTEVTFEATDIAGNSTRETRYIYYAVYQDLTVTAEHLADFGYTGEENENLIIPATFQGSDGTNYRVTGIGPSAFSECAGLTSITLPETITAIGESAFEGSGLTTIYFTGTEAQWASVTIAANNDSIIKASVICSDTSTAGD